MTIRASVLPLAEPGHAVLRLSGLDAAPDGLTLSLQRQQGPDSHLADDGWRRTEAWLLPAQVSRRDDALEFELGPEICDRLAGVATVRLRVKEPDIGVVGATVVAWPASMLTSGAASRRGGRDDDTVRLRRAEKPAPAPEPLPPVFEAKPDPMPDLRALRDPPLIPPSSGRMRWKIAALVLLAVFGVGHYVYTVHFQKEPEQAAAPPAPPAAAPTPEAPPPKKSAREVVGEFMGTRPTPDAMLTKGREFAKAGEMTTAFLIWRNAADAGHAPAQIEVAGFYDPLTQPAKAGFAPDAARAAELYERAALAGLAEAQRKFGLLLAKGAPGFPADPVKARSWLQQAAAQNDADARKALDSLKP